MLTEKEIINKRINVVQNKIYVNKKTSDVVPENLKNKYYKLFFSIMFTSFVIMVSLSHYTIFQDTFQIIIIAGFSLSLAEYFSRKFLKF